MGIQSEYNPDLALRHFSEFAAGRRKREECIPEHLVPGHVYGFRKRGQRLYWLQGEIPLVETKGNQQFSRPHAAVIILEATHFLQRGEPWTQGTYKVIEVFDPADPAIRFEGFSRV